MMRIRPLLLPWLFRVSLDCLVVGGGQFGDFQPTKVGYNRASACSPRISPRNSQNTSAQIEAYKGKFPSCANFRVSVRQVRRDLSPARERGAVLRLGPQQMVTALRSTADGLCLATAPLRFAPCTTSDVWEPALKDGELHLVSGKTTLRAASGSRGAVTRLCTDRFCVRCIGRGNGNRAKFGLCASGGEEVHGMTATSAPPLHPSVWLATQAAPPSRAGASDAADRPTR